MQNIMYSRHKFVEEFYIAYSQVMPDYKLYTYTLGFQSFLEI